MLKGSRFGAVVLAGLATVYLVAAILVFVITDSLVVPEGILATGSAIVGGLIVLVTRGWGTDAET